MVPTRSDSKCSIFNYTIEKIGWGGRIRTSVCRNQNPVPYHLATPHYFNRLGDILRQQICQCPPTCPRTYFRPLFTASRNTASSLAAASSCSVSVTWL